MKKYVLIIACIGTFMASCAPGANNILEDQMKAYNWKVTYMKDSNIDQTSTFANYVFNFEASDIVYAIRPDSTFTGTWFRTNTSQQNPKVQLDFGSHWQLYMMLHDWQQQSRTDNVIELVDNMAASGDAAVTFQRIP